MPSLARDSASRAPLSTGVFMQTLAHELLQIAEQAAKRYKRRCWWAPVEDLKQHAVVHMLRALETWDPERGTPLRAYLWRVACIRMSTYLWAESAPVSARDGGSHDGENHVAVALRGLHRAAFDAKWPCEQPRADAVLERRERAAVVRTELDALLGALDDSEAARRVLLEEEAPHEAAHALGIDESRVRRAVSCARRHLRQNARLYDAWRDM